MGLFHKLFEPFQSTPAPAPDRPRTLVLYKFDACPYCRRVIPLFEQLGIAVTFKDIRQDSQYRAELFDKTGRTQVPALEIDGEVLLESQDIAVWLREYAENQVGFERQAI